MRTDAFQIVEALIGFIERVLGVFERCLSIQSRMNLVHYRIGEFRYFFHRVSLRQDYFAK
jgi:hypothetical protein